MDNKSEYYHAIRVKGLASIELLEKILNQGIIPIKSGAYKSTDLRMNFENEICLSRPESKFRFRNIFLEYNSSFKDSIAFGNLILSVNGQIPGVYKPTKLRRETADRLILEGERGFTEYDDEYRTTIPIKPDSIEAVLFPATNLIGGIFSFNYQFGGECGIKISKKEKERIVKNYYEKVKETINKSGRDIPIYDLSTGIEITDSLDSLKKKK